MDTIVYYRNQSFYRDQHSSTLTHPRNPFLQYIRMLTIPLSLCCCCCCSSASAGVVVDASSALAARLNGRGLRFLKRKRSSVFRTRIATQQRTHPEIQIHHNYLSRWNWVIAPSRCMCVCGVRVTGIRTNASTILNQLCISITLSTLSHTHTLFAIALFKFRITNTKMQIKIYENNNNDKNIFYYVLCSSSSSSLSSSIIVTLRAWSVCAFIKWYHPHFISPIGGARGQKEKQTKARTFFFLRCVDVNISRATNWIDWMNWLTEWMSCLTEHRSAAQLTAAQLNSTSTSASTLPLLQSNRFGTANGRPTARWAHNNNKSSNSTNNNGSQRQQQHLHFQWTKRDSFPYQCCPFCWCKRK